jgi:hypothetical protein
MKWTVLNPNEKKIIHFTTKSQQQRFIADDFDYRLLRLPSQDLRQTDCVAGVITDKGCLIFLRYSMYNERKIIKF